MKEKLPKVFANKIEKNIDNNKKVYTSNNSTQKEMETLEKKNEPKNKIEQKKQKELKETKNKKIEQKINEILNSKKYIYRIPTKIELETKTIKTNIIGKNNKNIITIDNELIKIEDIKNIEIDEKNE